jgi:hypothetical protein
MNIPHALITTAVLASSLLLALVAEPATAMMTTAQLSIDDLGGSVQAHGGGHYTTLLHGNGTIASGIIVESTTPKPTEFALTCAVDSNAETLDCNGTLTVDAVSAPLRLRYADGQARYAMHSGYSNAHVAAWELWHLQALSDLVPPFDGGDDGGDGDDDGGDDGGWAFPNGIIVGEVWTTRDYSSESWTVILDGVVMNALWW